MVCVCVCVRVCVCVCVCVLCVCEHTWTKLVLLWQKLRCCSIEDPEDDEKGWSSECNTSTLSPNLAQTTNTTCRTIRTLNTSQNRQSLTCTLQAVHNPSDAALCWSRPVTHMPSTKTYSVAMVPTFLAPVIISPDCSDCHTCWRSRPPLRAPGSLACLACYGEAIFYHSESCWQCRK